VGKYFLVIFWERYNFFVCEIHVSSMVLTALKFGMKDAYDTRCNSVDYRKLNALNVSFGIKATCFESHSSKIMTN
jgi:hypothetical protein